MIFCREEDLGESLKPSHPLLHVGPTTHLSLPYPKLELRRAYLLDEILLFTTRSTLCSHCVILYAPIFRGTCCNSQEREKPYCLLLVKTCVSGPTLINLSHSFHTTMNVQKLQSSSLQSKRTLLGRSYLKYIYPINSDAINHAFTCDSF